jgi:hypothetical protein
MDDIFTEEEENKIWVNERKKKKKEQERNKKIGRTGKKKHRLVPLHREKENGINHRLSPPQAPPWATVKNNTTIAIGLYFYIVNI